MDRTLCTSWISPAERIPSERVSGTAPSADIDQRGEHHVKQTIRIVRRTMSVLPRDSRRFLVTFGIVMSVLALLDGVALRAHALASPALRSPGTEGTSPLVGGGPHTGEETMVTVAPVVGLISI